MRRGTEALWDKSRVKDGANVVRLLIHTHTHTHTHSSSGINLLKHTSHALLHHQPTLWYLLKSFILFDSILWFLPLNSTISALNCCERASRSNCYSLLLISEWYLLIKQHLPPWAFSAKAYSGAFQIPKPPNYCSCKSQIRAHQTFCERERKGRESERG